MVLQEHLFESFVIGIWCLAWIIKFFLFLPIIAGTLHLFPLIKYLIELFQIAEILQIVLGRSSFRYTIPHLYSVIALFSGTWKEGL